MFDCDMMFAVPFALLVLCHIVYTDAACNYPAHWGPNPYIDDGKGPVTFTDTTMDGWPVTFYTITAKVTSWECYMKNGSIIISTKKVMFRSRIGSYERPFYAFMCMVVEYVDSCIVYKLWSAPSPDALNGERVLLKRDSQATLCEVCDKAHIPDDSEIRHMCTKDTSGPIDKTRYGDPVTACSGQTTKDQSSPKSLYTSSTTLHSQTMIMFTTYIAETSETTSMSSSEGITETPSISSTVDITETLTSSSSPTPQSSTSKRMDPSGTSSKSPAKEPLLTYEAVVTGIVYLVVLLMLLIILISIIVAVALTKGKNAARKQSSYRPA